MRITTYFLYCAFIVTFGVGAQFIVDRAREDQAAQRIYWQIEIDQGQQRIVELKHEVQRLKNQKPRMTLGKTLQMPLKTVNRRLTQGYGQNLLAYGGMGLTGHPGVDFAEPEGTPVYAAHDGIVFEAFARDNGKGIGYGNRVKLRARYGAQGEETVYAHLSAVSVHVGDYVKAGQLIGKVGDTGFSSRAHLHFGVRYLWFCDKGGTQVTAPCEVLNGDNGMMGWVDPVPFISF